MNPRFRSAIAMFGADAKGKLANLAATGEPEDQLRAPLERLVVNLAEVCGLPRTAVVAVGESSLSELKTRPDYAITVRNALVGFIEVKAPGKGADPRRFRDRHDKVQWEKLQSLPNLMYTDGNEFSVWRSGQLVGSLVRLTGDIETSGADLDAPPGLLSLFENFIQWDPIPPRDAKQLAEVSARLCRLLREEVTEQRPTRSSLMVRPGSYVRHAHGPGARDPAQRRSRPRCQATRPDKLADRHRPAPPNGRRGEPGDAENLTRHAHACPRFRSLADDKQGQSPMLGFISTRISSRSTTINCENKPALTTRRPKSSAQWFDWSTRCFGVASGFIPAWRRRW